MCSRHRRPKLSMCGVIISFSKKCLCERDLVTSDIYYYITTEFGYAKHDIRPGAHCGVVLQRFEFIKIVWGRTVIDIAEILIVLQ